MINLITHEGRKQWPRKPLLYIAYNPHNNMYRYYNPNILKAMEIIQDFKDAVRKNKHTSWEIISLLRLNRTEKPKGNLVKCKKCKNVGYFIIGKGIFEYQSNCLNCNGTGKTTPQNYKGGRA